MLHGTIKTFLPERRFGFIGRDDNERDLFFHLDDAGIPDPVVGLRVEFEIKADRRDASRLRDQYESDLMFSTTRKPPSPKPNLAQARAEFLRKLDALIADNRRDVSAHDLAAALQSRADSVMTQWAINAPLR